MELRGLDSYAGEQIHCGGGDAGADWRRHDYAGKRVGVIDAGGSEVAAAEIIPELVGRAEFVKLFQRAPAWVLPRPLFAGAPALARRAARLHLRLTVKDPWLRRQLTPSPNRDPQNYGHVVVSAGYYLALQRGNCKLIDWPIATLSPAGVRTSDGVEHRLDAVVFTG